MLKVYKYRFYEHRKIYFAISIFLILFGIVMAFINGVNLDIQFKGGSIIDYSFQGDLDKDAVAVEANKILNMDTSVQETEDITNHTKQIVLNIATKDGLTADLQEKLLKGLQEKFPGSNLKVTQTLNVDPFYGQEFLTRGIWAIVLASLLIVIYVWIRYSSIYGLSAGVMALVALLHDVLMVFATFVIFRIPLNDAFIAVVLTILGYSINDTIVNYDRIRENKRIYGKRLSMPELVDLSLNQSLSRTINTVLTTLFTMIVITAASIIFNLESIRNFALPMVVGIITGCYSSIAIASPLWVMWNTRGGRNQAVLEKAPAKKADKLPVTGVAAPVAKPAEPVASEEGVAAPAANKPAQPANKPSAKKKPSKSYKKKK